MSITSKFVPSTDGSLVYAEAIGDPSKPALILVPGYTLSTQVFDKQFEDEELRRELYLIRYDPRGHGQTSKPETEEGHASKLYADDFAAVCKAFGVRKPVFAGWSLAGAIVADICTHLGADFISGAILLAGLPSLSPESFSAIPPQFLSTIVPDLFSTETSVHRNTILHFASKLFVDPNSIPFSVRCAWIGATFFIPAPVFQLVLSRPQSVKELEEAGKEGKLKFLCINAEKDAQRAGGVPVVELLKPTFSDVEEVVIKDAGHAFFYEKPQETNRALLEFVRKVAF
ncbi:hypothetical protein D9758_014013 [Tetrapyrgos nigripes]|uniref:AB hydrolase-1 domain-containing protein n=1 Tax=Tetrapyrgos nigripes TaxID=182062 RepID=A0A8H5CXM6_9AGAR|nr:hypothetical protein D9758_014013 [Tetrapyrgos nigripes]